MLLIALINLVAVGGIKTSLFNVSIMMMLPYLLILMEIMTFMMWNKLKNLLHGRMHSNLLICLKILYKYEVCDILKFCFNNYKEENGYILKYLNRCSPTEETNALKESMEEEIAETGSSLDEKEEESDDPEEEEWSYPCLPPNKSNYLTNALFDHPPCLTNEDLCDIYIVEFVHDATKNYYDKGKYGCWNFHITKTPLFILKVLKLLLFYLPMLVTICFFDLFSYKIPMHRKWVRLKCVSYFLLDALFCFNSYFLM
jgi:hypothetical protein